MRKIFSNFVFFSESPNFRKNHGIISIGMDLPPIQIKLASCTRPVLFDFNVHMMEVVVLEIKNKIV